MIEARFLDSLDQCFSRTDYKYNDKNDLLEESTFDADESLIFKKSFEFTYYTSGNWIKRLEFENDSLIQIIERKISYFDD